MAVIILLSVLCYYCLLGFRVQYSFGFVVLCHVWFGNNLAVN